MSLTPAELAAARGFRAAQRAVLAHREPADITVSVFIGNDRHDCPAQGGKSVFLKLREHYVFSPLLVLPDAVIPARRFGWIWTEGTCRACGMTARSSSGRLVDPEIRPPSEHALVADSRQHERQARPRPADPRQPRP